MKKTSVAILWFASSRLRCNTLFRVEPNYQLLLRQIGITDAWAAFEHPQIKVWRSITERENATIDAEQNGGPIRLHLKRDKTPQHHAPAGAEAAQILALNSRGIPTANLVAYGWLDDGRSFVLTEDLGGYSPADRAIHEGAVSFDQIVRPSAQLIAKLHASAAFHRDLYLCHIFVRPGDIDLRLIDAARVLIKPWLKWRWRIKDLSQLIHSARELNIAPQRIESWIDAYSSFAPLSNWSRRMAHRKADWIARHDARLRARQPDRNVSIPT